MSFPWFFFFLTLKESLSYALLAKYAKYMYFAMVLRVTLLKYYKY